MQTIACVAVQSITVEFFGVGREAPSNQRSQPGYMFCRSAVVNGVVRRGSSGRAPESGATFYAAFIQHIKLNRKFSQARFVVVEVVRDSLHCFQARIRGRHSFAHHFNNCVRPADTNIFFAAPGGACCTYFVIHIISSADDGRIAHAAWNFPGHSGCCGRS